jgi:cytochrome oxidase Cu insertion factor (SCO1/SenC/PrrC family)
MKKSIHVLFITKLILIAWMLSAPLSLWPQDGDISITIHLRGVYESKISLMALTPAGTFKPVKEVNGVKNGETTILAVEKKLLPGEFVLRFDYKENVTSTPYPSEKFIFAYNQDLELWVVPMFSNNPDSTYFQPGERENGAFFKFSAENARKREKLGVLQNFLMSYDDTGAKLYQEAIKEYEQRRQGYNQWLEERAEQDKELFVSNVYSFQHVVKIPWEGTENDRILSLIGHYFDGTDFKDSLIIKTADINKWMDNYVNLYGQMVTTAVMRDSLFALAGKTAIEKAKAGHPLVYGWMVDYFYRGYEVNGIDAGIKILEPYLNDPNCLTTKRQEISRRLKGIETLVPGSKAPDITLTDSEGKPFELYKTQTTAEYILILFWSADCEHCESILDALYPWQREPEISKKLMIAAVSLDETDTEISVWKQKITSLPGWKHMLAPEGVRSQAAYDYFILATPVMILLDAKTKNIVSSPGSMMELMAAVE